MIIAVDFDGTIVEHRYPEIGREIPFAVETLKKLIEDRHQLILWSVREGRLLDEAVEWCRQRGVEFYAVNKDFPEEDTDKNRHYSHVRAAQPEGVCRYVHRRPQLGRTSGLGYHLPDDQRKEKHGATVTGRMGRRPTRGTKEEKEMVVLTSIPFSFRTLYIKKVSILIIKMVLTEITTASVPGF